MYHVGRVDAQILVAVEVQRVALVGAFHPLAVAVVVGIAHIEVVAVFHRFHHLPVACGVGIACAHDVELGSFYLLGCGLVFGDCDFVDHDLVVAVAGP